jgi:hypothetical protein
MLMHSAPVNIVTLKWGKRYDAAYVNRLRSAAVRNLTAPHRFICFTDDTKDIGAGVEVFDIPDIDLPPDAKTTGWRKLCLFRDDLPLAGLCLFLDLDIVVTGRLDDFFTFGAPEEIPIIHNWVPWRKTILRNAPEIGNSSVFRFQANGCRFVWDQFHREKDWALANFRPPQSYLTHCIRPRMRYWPAEWVRSFKRHCRPVFPLNWIVAPRLPNGARIIAFHGKPDPDEAAAGYRGTSIHHFSRPSPWIDEHWK